MEYAPLQKWNLADIWNEVAFKENKPLQRRDYVYASEISQSFSDRFHKMNAVPMTNPPNSRSLRKFLAGNLWEFAVKQVLILCGIYHKDEVKVDASPYSDTLDVHGRLDFIAGGTIDGERAFHNLEQANLPEVLFKIGVRIIERLNGQLLETKILELKSCSSYVIDKVQKLGAALPHHSQQGYHYQKNSEWNAAVSYISKDDSLMAEFNVDSEKCEPIYRKDLEQITYYFTKGITPPPEPLVSFDELTGKFQKNIIGVEYSPYLTMTYGFATPDDYRKSVTYVESWNRVLSRYVQAETGVKTASGKPINITPKNKEVREAIENAGYDFNKLLDAKIALGVLEEENED